MLETYIMLLTNNHPSNQCHPSKCSKKFLLEVQLLWRQGLRKYGGPLPDSVNSAYCKGKEEKKDPMRSLEPQSLLSRRSAWRDPKWLVIKQPTIKNQMGGGALASHGVFCGWKTWRNFDITQTLMDISQTPNLLSMWLLSLRHILTYCVQLWLLA